MSHTRLKERISLSTGTDLQAVVGSGVRTTPVLVSSSTTAQLDLPSGASVVIVRATDAVWLRFGTSDMGAAAADANSILFLGGEAVLKVPSGATHYCALRVGSSNVYLQIERVD